MKTASEIGPIRPISEFNPIGPTSEFGPTKTCSDLADLETFTYCKMSFLFCKIGFDTAENGPDKFAVLLEIASSNLGSCCPSQQLRIPASVTSGRLAAFHCLDGVWPKGLDSE